jgi:hypothetical protein
MTLTCNFQPSICKVSEENPEPKFSGEIKLKPLAYEDRLEMIESQSLAHFESSDDVEKKSMAMLRFAKEFARDKLESFFISSTLVRLSDGYAFDTLEKIKYDGPASTCIPEISAAIVSGSLSLGK